MMGYSGMSIRDQKGVETRMKTIINLYGKGNEVCFLMCIPLMIVSSFKQQLSMHALLSMMHVAPYLGGSN
jgi:hypothetical protein